MIAKIGNHKPPRVIEEFFMPERALPPSYDINFDRQNFSEQLVRRNLETDLGERFNVVISKTKYYFDGHLLKSQGDIEPFVETIKKGIQERQKYAGDHDRKRELAEFENFNKVQTYLLEDNLVISVSPKGPRDSCYQRNYFDLYEKTSGNEVLMTRFSTQMSIRELTKAMQQINPDFGLGSEVDDIYLLQNPISTNLSTNQILEIFHPDYEALREEELEKLLIACQPLIFAYINSLIENPNDVEIYRRALLNFADDFILKPKTRGLLQYQLQDAAFMPVFASQLAARPVRYVVAGCGAQGDLLISNFSPYSVVEFASGKKTSSEKTLNCRCPFCNRHVEANISSGRITCPECGNSAPYQC